jgi:hypothetical protein
LPDNYNEWKKQDLDDAEREARLAWRAVERGEEPIDFEAEVKAIARALEKNGKSKKGAMAEARLMAMDHKRQLDAAVSKQKEKETGAVD